MNNKAAIGRPLLAILIICLLAACDSGTPATSTPTAAPSPPATATLQPEPPTPAAEASPTEEANIAAKVTVQPTEQEATATVASALPTGTVVDEAAVAQPPTPNESLPSPTAVTATGTGADITALQALAILKARALAWQPDARLGLLSNTRPGQQKNLLGDALGKPDINEATPGGKGRNWTLLAFSPGANAAAAFSMDGTQVDLKKEGAISDDALARFTGPATAALALASLDPTKLTDSDKLVEAAGKRGRAAGVGVALLSPDGLGIGPLPTPQAGGAAPSIAYELFSGDETQQNFAIYDALTGSVVIDSAAP